MSDVQVDAPVDAPVVDAPVDAPVEGAVDTPVTEDPFAAYGGEQYIKDAVYVAQSIADPQRLPAVVANGLISLGYTPEQAYAAVLNQGFTPAEARAAVEQAEPEVEADPWAELADDDVLTVADAKAQFERMLEQRFAAERNQSAQQAAAAQRQQAADSAVTSTLEAKGLKPGADNTVAVLTLAQRFVDQNEWDPRKLSAAIEQGYAMWQGIIEGERKGYISEKAAVAEAQPSHLGGASPGGSAEPEPQTVQEAIERARKYLNSQR